MKFSLVTNKENCKTSTVRNKQDGFTLIEAMVAIAVFTVVMVIGISALLNVNNTNKKSQNLRTIIDNLSFTMEDMSRNLKLGSYYHCVVPNDDPLIVLGQANDFLAIAQSCGSQYSLRRAGGVWAVALEPMSGIPADSNYPGLGRANATDQVVYRFALYTNDFSNCYLEKSIDGGSSFVRITPTEIHINCEKSGFNIYNTSADTFSTSPRALIRISGTIVYKDVTTTFSLQTEASQRNINVVTP